MAIDFNKIVTVVVKIPAGGATLTLAHEEFNLGATGVVTVSEVISRAIRVTQTPVAQS